MQVATSDGLVVGCAFGHHARMPDCDIHPTAVIHPQAELEAGVEVGAYAVIGADVRIGAGTIIGPHAVLEGPLRLGPRNHLAAHVTLGLPPQDDGYAGEPTELVIGSDNRFREFFTAHRASTKEDGVTRIGSHNLFMAYSHIGHDGRIGDRVTISNASQLAGHVQVDDRAYISAVCGIHQFVRIGSLSMVGGGAVVTQDVAPYCTVTGNRARLRGLNHRGLQRAGLDAGERRRIRQAYDLVFRRGLTREQARQAITDDPGLATPWVEALVAFMTDSNRGLVR